MRKKTWIRPHHRIVRNILYVILGPYCRIRYGIRVEPFREQEDRPYLILLNHQTPFDQFFVGMSFRNPIYYMASEDIFSNGWVSSLIRWLIAPIPIKKQTTDITAVMTCIKVAREGGTIAIAPEGNRTYSGRTVYMRPGIAPLARKLKVPIALYRIEGGYGTEPRWSDVVRRGKMRSYVSRVIQPEEYEKLTNDQLMDIIRQELYVDEANTNGIFKSNKRAEYLERAIYVCPFCGLSEFESHGNEITCKTCGKSVHYGENKQLQGVGFDFPFPFVAQWYDYQEEFICGMDVTTQVDQPLFEDTARLSEVIVYKHKELLRKQASIRLYGDRVVIDEGTAQELVFPFSEADAVTVLGRNKLNIYHNKHVYQFKGSKRFNALKYVHIYNRYCNIARGESDNKFLGL